jgi:hypothetical protein
MGGNIVRQKAALVLGCVILLALFLAPGTALAAKPAYPEASGGMLDLSSWNFEEDGPLSLSGKWEFYWGSLIEPGGFQTESSSSIQYATVPQAWGDAIKGHRGEATYRLRIELGESQAKKLKAVYIRGIASAYRLYVNTEKLLQGHRLSRPGRRE